MDSLFISVCGRRRGVNTPAGDTRFHRRAFWVITAPDMALGVAPTIGTYGNLLALFIV